MINQNNKMSTKDRMIEILNATFNDIVKCVPQSTNKAESMKNPKHLELIERYAKVLSHHYVGKLAHVCTNLLAYDFSNDEQTNRMFNKFENKMQSIVDGFPKDMDTTLKSIKKYFGQNYSSECLTNVATEYFVEDLKTEKDIFLDWAENLEIDSDLEDSNVNEKVSA